MFSNVTLVLFVSAITVPLCFTMYLVIQCGFVGVSSGGSQVQTTSSELDEIHFKFNGGGGLAILR